MFAKEEYVSHTDFGKEYYVPSDQGSEVRVRNRLAQIKQIKTMVHRNRMIKQNPKGGKS